MLQRYSIKHDLDNTEENDRGGWVLYEDVRQRIAWLEAALEDSRSKHNLLEKTLYAENQALREQNRRLVESMKAAIEWIEDDRWGDYIVEQWYHDGKAALDAAGKEGE